MKDVVGSVALQTKVALSIKGYKHTQLILFGNTTESSLGCGAVVHVQSIQLRLNNQTFSKHVYIYIYRARISVVDCISSWFCYSKVIFQET